MNIHFLYPYLFLLMCSMGLITSCVEEDEELPSQLVVEGWIEAGSHPIVQLGESYSVSEQTQNINDYMVRWGKVSISDGTKTVILTGGYDDRYFPPYKYTSTQIIGEVGKTYILTAEYKGKKVTAKTTIPQPVTLQSLQAVQMSCDTLFYVKACFTDIPEHGNYYGLFCKKTTEDKAFLLSPMGILSDEVLDGEVEAAIYRGTSIFAKNEKYSTRYFKSGDNIQVKLCHMDHVSYLFWQSYSNMIELSSNMFFPYTQNLKSNIQGGKGYWCGYGTSTHSISIP